MEHIFVYLILPQDYLILNLPCFKKKIIRICGNGFEAVPLTEDEITFIKWCDTNLRHGVAMKYDSQGNIELSDKNPDNIKLVGKQYKRNQVCIEFKLINKIHKVWIAYTLQGIEFSIDSSAVYDNENVMIAKAVS